MSGYLRWRPLLALAADGHPISKAQVEVLSKAERDRFPTETGVVHPGGPEDQAGRELRIAADVLRAIADGEAGAALGHLLHVLASPLVPSPFETALEELGARLATSLGDGVLASRFLERRRVYRDRYAGGAALVGLAGLLADPDVFDAVARALGPPVAQADLATPEPAHVSATHPWMPLDPGFAPFSVEEETPNQANAYVVTLRHLEDARTAGFAVHRVVWHELEGDDPEISDLVLSFETNAADMLRGLDPELLRLRLFFGDGPAFDEVATADGSLFDVEVNPPEGRIYLKLRRPAAWSATNLPAAELWRQLRSCVLIAEQG